MFDIKLNDRIENYIKSFGGIPKAELESYLNHKSIPISSFVNILENDNAFFDLSTNSSNKSKIIDNEKNDNIDKNQTIFKVKKDNLSNNENVEISIKTLLKNVEFKFKDKYVPTSNYSSEFKEHLHQLRLKLDENEYQDMLKKKDDISLKTKIKMGISNDNDNGEWISPAQINKQIKEQTTTIFNILVSVASVVYAIWYWTNSSGYFALEMRIFLCLFFGLLILVAEIVVYNGYLNKIEAAKRNEKNKKIKKKVIKTFDINNISSLKNASKFKND